MGHGVAAKLGVELSDRALRHKALAEVRNAQRQVLPSARRHGGGCTRSSVCRAAFQLQAALSVAASRALLASLGVENRYLSPTTRPAVPPCTSVFESLGGVTQRSALFPVRPGGTLFRRADSLPHGTAERARLVLDRFRWPLALHLLFGDYDFNPRGKGSSGARITTTTVQLGRYLVRIGCNNNIVWESTMDWLRLQSSHLNSLLRTYANCLTAPPSAPPYPQFPETTSGHIFHATGCPTSRRISALCASLQ